MVTKKGLTIMARRWRKTSRIDVQVFPPTWDQAAFRVRLISRPPAFPTGDIPGDYRPWLTVGRPLTTTAAENLAKKFRRWLEQIWENPQEVS